MVTSALTQKHGVSKNIWFFAISVVLILASLLIWARTARAQSGEAVSIHRFYSDSLRHHFYTASETEKNQILSKYPQSVWRYEGAPFRVYGTENCTGRDPVYRFWSDKLQAHFYTMSVVEKDEIMRRYPANVWRFEGIAFCAFKESAGSDRVAIHRFWSPTNQSHFYTSSEVEMKNIRENYSPSVWTYEGISYYALPLLNQQITFGSSTVLASAHAIIPAGLFGMHLQNTGAQATPWPATVRLPALRMHDTRMNWAQLEPAQDTWEFKTMDAYVARAGLNGADLIYTLGQTPKWAAARPNDPTMYYEVTTSGSEPKSMVDWRDYVRTVATRYKGKITGYEVWNEPNYNPFYTGSVDKMVEMTREARLVLKEIDPSIVVISPSPTGEDGEPWLDEFLSKGGGNYVDVIAFHFYSVEPETDLVASINRVKNIMKKYGVEDKPLWNTESGWCIQNPKTGFTTSDLNGLCPTMNQVMTVDEASSFVARTYLLSWWSGISRYYWYAWDDTSFGLTERDRSTLKAPAIAFSEVQKWMEGKRMEGCTTDTTETWTCTLVDASSKKSYAIWNLDRSAVYLVPVDSQPTVIRTLAGGRIAVPATRQITVGPSPVLVE